jgi:hypothetical protein
MSIYIQLLVLVNLLHPTTIMGFASKLGWHPPYPQRAPTDETQQWPTLPSVPSKAPPVDSPARANTAHLPPIPTTALQHTSLRVNTARLPVLRLHMVSLRKGRDSMDSLKAKDSGRLLFLPIPRVMDRDSLGRVSMASNPDKDSMDSSRGKGNMASRVRASTVNSPDRVNTDSNPDKGSTVSSPDRVNTASNQDKGSTVSSPDRDNTASSPDNMVSNPVDNLASMVNSPDKVNMVSNRSRGRDSMVSLQLANTASNLLLPVLVVSTPATLPLCSPSVSKM